MVNKNLNLEEPMFVHELSLAYRMWPWRYPGGGCAIFLSYTIYRGMGERFQ